MRKKGPTSSKTLDLHGFQRDQVADAIDLFLRQAAASGAPQVRIMTGKGKGIVKKETLSYLKSAGYPWKYEKLPNGSNNEGVLVIFMD